VCLDSAVEWVRERGTRPAQKLGKPAPGAAAVSGSRPMLIDAPLNLHVDPASSSMLEGEQKYRRGIGGWGGSPRGAVAEELRSTRLLAGDGCSGGRDLLSGASRRGEISLGIGLAAALLSVLISATVSLGRSAGYAGGAGCGDDAIVDIL